MPVIGAYRGWSTCVSCHPKETQNWKMTAHFRAYATLSKNRQETNRECVPCHVVGWRKEGGTSDLSNVGQFQDVQCEACHGPAYDHVERPEFNKFIAITEQICTSCHVKELDVPSHDKAFRYEERLERATCVKEHPADQPK